MKVVNSESRRATRLVRPKTATFRSFSVPTLNFKTSPHGPKTGGKRSAPPTLTQTCAPPQKNKPADGPKKYTIKPKEKGKEKAADRGTIPIPSYAATAKYGGAASFLHSLDQAGISRSKKETERLHQNLQTRTTFLSRSHDEDEGDWSSDLPSDEDENEDSDDSMHPLATWIRTQKCPTRPHLENGDLHGTHPRPSEDTDEESEDEDEVPEEPRREDSRAARIQGAKDQIASICQEIVGDPENSLGLLRRLHTFSLAEISTPATRAGSQRCYYSEARDPLQLAVKEKMEKVSQMVARTRDWEQGLVVVYQTYLRALEAELKARSELADIALNAMCTLVTEVTHFNFRVNLMSCIVARLSKKSWIRSVSFPADLTGTASLEIVRLLNRMVKEKRFNIHPTVLSCLLHLRLKTELGVRASESHTDKPEPVKRSSYGKDAARRAKGKPTAQPHLSKKARKVLKEKKEIDREFREAEAEVDKEERAVTVWISKYAHLVNIDFFKDLLKVLKELVAREVDGDEADEADASKDVQLRLQCIVTAFELLSGQGEALNIDLSDFISRLYALIMPLSLVDPGTGPTDMLFRALNIVFSPRTFGAAAPPWRAAAFAKRLLTAALHWPPAAAVRALEFVGGLLAKDAKLAALLSTEERAQDGAYRADVDDPQLCNPFGTCFLGAGRAWGAALGPGCTGGGAEGDGVCAKREVGWCW
ncbi:CBF/Mak21 family-domain-containing protein [Mycena leptocephala]|nr:CBF/Mak21 family-domain-containing protein [Mycena leptocephala]